LGDERIHLIKEIGYKEHHRIKTFQSTSKGHRDNDQTNEVFKVFLPYIQGTNIVFARVLKRRNIGVVFKPLTTI